MKAYIVSKEDINEFLGEMEEIGHTWSGQSKPTTFNPFLHGMPSASELAIYINSFGEMSWCDKMDFGSMEIYKPKRNSTIPETFSKPYGEPKDVLQDDQFLIDNSEGIVEVDTQKLRSFIIQKIKTERELKVTQGKLEKLQEEVKALRENEVSLKCSIAKKMFVDLTKY